ncbi:MAG TPA: hypothetical protein PK443_00205 [bacterium]|nr:hypothetical protein [bacterium]
MRGFGSLIKNKKAQAMVEFLLLIAVLAPMIYLFTGTISNRLFGALSGWIGKEIQTRARYGYSYQYYKSGGIINDSNLTNTSGVPPVPYTGAGTAPDPVHPIAKVREGWAQD